MKMIPVISSNVKAIGYEKNVIIDDGFNPKDILRIEYLSGYIYDYLNVSEDVYNELMSVESKGSFIYRKLKDKYTCIKRN